MLFHELPFDVLNKIIFHTNIHTQKELMCVSKTFYEFLEYKIKIYENELQNIVLYIKNVFLYQHFSQFSFIAKYIKFRCPNNRIKITFSKILKLNLSCKIENENNIIEKIQINHYFLKIDDLISFIINQVQNCNMYSNTLLFSQKYHYYKIY